MLTSKHPLKIEISPGLGPFSQIELLKTGRMTSLKITVTRPIPLASRWPMPSSGQRMACGHRTSGFQNGTSMSPVPKQRAEKRDLGETTLSRDSKVTKRYGCMAVWLYGCMSVLCMYVCLYVCMSVCLCVCMSLLCFLYVWLYGCMAVWLYIR